MDKIERWLKQNIPTLHGKIAVITGANSGIGFEAAKTLAGQGARVVLAVRNDVKGGRAVREIRNTVPQADLEVMPLDLASLASVRSFAESYRQKHDRLDVLINNAGVMAIPRRETVDGYEMQFGTNHLGHFALTGLLLPALLKTPLARVVTVSSNMHKFGGMDFDDLQGERRYSKWGSYCQSKLANLLFAYELQRRLAAAGASAISVAAHPGYAATNLQAVGPDMEGSKIQRMSMTFLNRTVAQSAAMGALPAVYAAASPNVRGGDYVGPSGIVEQRGWPKITTSSGPSRDEAAAARLWTLSEQFSGVPYVFDFAGSQWVIPSLAKETI